MKKSIAVACAIAFGLGTIIIIPVNLLMGGKILTGLVVNLILCITLLPYHLYQVLTLLVELDSLSVTMNEKSIHDELTQAYNRHYLQDLTDPQRNQETVIPLNTSILLIDLDDFKMINDKHGHHIGDMVLRSLVHTCQSVFRSTDILVRYGGDEFICILPDTGKDHAIEIAKRLQNEIKRLSIPVMNSMLHFTISIGVANTKEKQSMEKLISLADKSLYEAKRQGKNRINILE